MNKYVLFLLFNFRAFFFRTQFLCLLKIILKSIILKSVENRSVKMSLLLMRKLLVTTPLKVYDFNPTADKDYFGTHEKYIEKKNVRKTGKHPIEQ